MPADTTEGTVSGGARPPETVYVWDVFVRIFHWSLVGSFAIAWLTADEWDRVHEWAGYAAIALVGMRIIWGLIGTQHARFKDFVTSPATFIAYVRDVIRGGGRRRIGHNPAGGMMILALLTGIIGLGVTGYMMTLDAFWSAEWLEEVHEALANAVLALVVLHVLGVIAASIKFKENLVLAMFTGRKRKD